jgi:acetyl esterase/lipase
MAGRSSEEAGCLLICLHGGGFTSDSGSLIESIPIAALTGTKVVSVLYRLAPQFPFPVAAEESTPKRPILRNGGRAVK